MTMERTESSACGRFFFRVACCLGILGVVGIISTIGKTLPQILDACLVGGMVFVPAALCWYIGFCHDYNKVMRGELYSERSPELCKGNDGMKWLTSRVVLNSNTDMAGAISAVLISFVGELKAQDKIKCWYSSLKNDDGIPSFRLYLEIDENDESFVKAELDEFLRKNADQIGWAGEYFNPDPVFDPLHADLAEIIQACESARKLVNAYPALARIEDRTFWSDVRAEVDRCLSSMDPDHHAAYLHFVANNLGMPDNVFCKLGGY